VGSPEYCEEQAKKRISKIEKLSELLVSLDNYHAEFILMKSCVLMPKLGFLLRTCPSHLYPQSMNTFVTTSEATLTRLVGRLPEDAIGQRFGRRVALPFGQGFPGLGWTDATRVAECAYLGSRVQSLALQAKLLQSFHISADSLRQECSTLLDSFNAPLPPSYRVNFEPLLAHSKPQSLLTKKKMEAESVSLFREMYDQDPRSMEVVSFIVGGRPGAGAFLNYQFGTPLLHSLDFRCAVRTYCGLPVYTEDFCCSHCRQPSDRHGKHALTCRHGSACFRRHDAVVELLANLFRSLGYMVRREGAILGNDNANRRPGDLVVKHFSLTDLYIDVSVVGSHRVATPLYNDSWVLPEELSSSDMRKWMKGLSDSVYEGAEAEKRRSSEDIVTRAGHRFLPFIVGSHGGFGKAAEGLLTRLAATAGLRGGTSAAWAKLRSMVSINAAVQQVQTSGFIYGTDDLPGRFNDIL